MVTSMLSALYLASSNTSSIDLSYIDTLPSPDAPTLHCTAFVSSSCTSARVLMGEVLEREGRHSDAITWSQAELQVDPPFCCCATYFTSFSDFNVLVECI
jgi:hypothetical protein